MMNITCIVDPAMMFNVPSSASRFFSSLPLKNMRIRVSALTPNVDPARSRSDPSATDGVRPPTERVVVVPRSVPRSCTENCGASTSAGSLVLSASSSGGEPPAAARGATCDWPCFSAGSTGEIGPSAFGTTATGSACGCGASLSAGGTEDVAMSAAPTPVVGASTLSAASGATRCAAGDAAPVAAPPPPPSTGAAREDADGTCSEVELHLCRASKRFRRSSSASGFCGDAWAPPVSCPAPPPRIQNQHTPKASARMVQCTMPADHSSAAIAGSSPDALTRSPSMIRGTSGSPACVSGSTPPITSSTGAMGTSAAAAPSGVHWTPASAATGTGSTRTARRMARGLR
mmetsp:Transcript_110789/g.357588  ORF Transcript_110789/g.357588 Transcript_110789/m.357588 type:complete len:345 (-) Transcript_110789:68-1102(-)